MPFDRETMGFLHRIAFELLRNALTIRFGRMLTNRGECVLKDITVDHYDDLEASCRNETINLKFHATFLASPEGRRPYSLIPTAKGTTTTEKAYINRGAHVILMKLKKRNEHERYRLTITDGYSIMLLDLLLQELLKQEVVILSRQFRLDQRTLPHIELPEVYPSQSSASLEHNLKFASQDEILSFRDDEGPFETIVVHTAREIDSKHKNRHDSSVPPRPPLTKSLERYLTSCGGRLFDAPKAPPLESPEESTLEYEDEAWEPKPRKKPKPPKLRAPLKPILKKKSSFPLATPSPEPSLSPEVGRDNPPAEEESNANRIEEPPKRHYARSNRESVLPYFDFSESMEESDTEEKEEPAKPEPAAKRRRLRPGRGQGSLG